MQEQHIADRDISAVGRTAPIPPEYVSGIICRQCEKVNYLMQLRNLRDSAATILHKRGFDANSVMQMPPPQQIFIFILVLMICKPWLKKWKLLFVAQKGAG